MDRTRNLHIIFLSHWTLFFALSNFAAPTEWVDTLPFFKDPEKRLLTNVVVDNEDNVFVAGNNVLHHFSSDLELKETVVTGPLMDNAYCMHPSIPCSKTQKVPTDNTNHVLEMVYHLGPRPSLLLCGTVYRRICQIRPVDNLTEYHWVHPFDQRVGFTGGPYATRAFFGSGYNNQLTLFTASTDHGPYGIREGAPFLTSKVIEKDGDRYTFRYAFQSGNVKSAVDFSGRAKRSVIDGGFVYDGFVYTLMITELVFFGVETNVVRVCARDGTFRSYSELTIACQHTSGKLKGILGGHMGDSPSSDGKSLYVLFSRLEGSNAGTALCIFPMTQIVDAFTHFPRKCVTTVGSDCLWRKTKNVITDFCGPDVSPYSVSELVVPYFNFSAGRSFTAITTVRNNNEVVAILGQNNGLMKKMSLKSGQLIAFNDLLDINTTGSFRSPFVFDRQHKHIYALNNNKVVKYPVETCNVHRSCESCLIHGGKIDPLNCGWCAGQCAHLQECSDPGSFTQDTCTPTIYEMSPQKGPIQGGIKIQITGDSLGSYVDDEHNSISVAGIPCTVVDWKNREVTCTIGPAPEGTSGPVELHIDMPFSASIGYRINGSTTSPFNFYYYVGPKPYGIFPNKGPTSGGTHVTIFGENFDFEKGQKRYFIVCGRLCNLKEFNKTTAKCVTGNVTIPDYPDKIAIVVGNKTFVMDENSPPTFDHPDMSQSFEYIPDPEIHLIRPGFTTVSGLMNVTVTGLYLDSVLSPKIVVKVPISKIKVLEFPEECWSDPESQGTTLTCATPSILGKPWVPIPTRTHPLQTHVSFIMDGVQWLREFPKHQEFMSRLLYYPDPEFRTFRDLEKISDDQTTMEIKGNHLDLLRSADNFQIRLGEEKSCKITSFSTELLVCDLPPTLKNTSLIGTNISVEVFMGSTRQHLGYIEIMPAEKNQVVWGLLLLAICVLTLFSGIVIAFLCFRKLLKNKRVRSIHTIALSAQPPHANEYRALQVRNNPPADRQLSQTSCRTNRQLSQASSSTPFLDDAQNHFEEVPILDREDQFKFEEGGLLIQKSELTFGGTIGEGHFGQVFVGFLQRPNEDKIKVALKTLRKNVRNNTRKAEAFIQEALIMMKFNDPNVLRLIGICIEGGVPYMVLEYMENGDLNEYIRDDTKPLLKVSDLLKFGLDIASGMCYLAKEKFVHRDLAARNCVLDSSLQVKVADFGMSRDIYEGEYYRSQDENREVPCRWVAPEALEKGKYTTNSDVWSYGVLLWELMTRGSNPYPNVFNNWEILGYIKGGNRMKQPKFCPKPLYLCMLACWNTEPDKRPSFFELYSYVKEMHRILLEEDSANTIEGYTPAEGANSAATVVGIYCNDIVPAQNTDYFDSEELYLQMDGHALSKDYLRKE